MIPQIVLVCLFFQLGYGDYLKIIPGQYPGEKELNEAMLAKNGSPFVAEALIPLWAHAVRGLASEENSLKLVFRFFNRPDWHRYILDVILLVGNLNVTDEGYWPYFKREDGRVPLQPTVDKILASTEPSTVETLTSTESEGAEHDIDLYSEYMVYPSAEVYQSTAQKSDIPEHSIQQATGVDGEALELTKPRIDSTAEYVVYQSTEDKEVPRTTDDGTEQSEYTEESTEHQSPEEDSSTFKHRYGYKYPHYKPRREWHHKNPHHEHHKHHDSSEESSEEESSEEVDRRTGLAPEPESMNRDSAEPGMVSTTEYIVYHSTEDEEVPHSTTDGIEYTEESIGHQSSEEDSSKFQHRYGYKHRHYKPRREWHHKYPRHEHHKHHEDSSEESSEEESSEEVDRTGLALEPESMYRDSVEPGMDSTTEYVVYQSTEEVEGFENTEDSTGHQFSQGSSEYRSGYKHPHSKTCSEWHKYPNEQQQDDDSSELSEMDHRTGLGPQQVSSPESMNLDSTKHCDELPLGSTNHDSMENIGKEVHRLAVNEMESKFMDPESAESRSLEEDSSDLEHRYGYLLTESQLPLQFESESVERRSGLHAYQIDHILGLLGVRSTTDYKERVDPTTESPLPRLFRNVFPMMDSPMEASRLLADEVESEESSPKSTEQPSGEESSKFERRYGHDHPHGIHRDSKTRGIRVPEPHGIHASEHHVPKPHGIPDHVSELHYVKPDSKRDCKDHPHHHKGRPTKTRQVGSLRGVPGVHFPNYREIPITSFTCSDKNYIPGFYADMETGCQVFHVCWPHRRESFLCPIGTIFNQPLLACDYWYNGDCSLSPQYYDVNKNAHISKQKIPVVVDHFEDKFVPERPRPVVIPERPTVIDHFEEEHVVSEDPRPVSPEVIDHFEEEHVVPEHPRPVIPERPIVIDHLEKKPLSKPFKKWSEILKFLPVKSKVTVYPESVPGSFQKLKHSVPVKESKLAKKADGKAAKKAFAAKVIQDVLGVAEGLVNNVEPLLAQVASVGHLPLKSVHGVMGKKQVKQFGNPSVPKVVIPSLGKPASEKIPGFGIRKLDRSGDYYDYDERDYGPPKKYMPKKERLRKKNQWKLDYW